MCAYDNCGHLGVQQSAGGFFFGVIYFKFLKSILLFLRCLRSYYEYVNVWVNLWAGQFYIVVLGDAKIA